MFEYILSGGYQGIQSQLLPLAIIAILIDAAIISAWYIMGVLLNNRGVKVSALNEFYQIIGTVIMVSIIIYSLTIFSMIFYSSLNNTKLMDQTTLSNMCTSLTTNSPLTILGKSKGSLLVSQSKSYNGICDYVNKLSGSSPGTPSGSSVTAKIDYPLAASALINANLTNQVAVQLNNLFEVDAFIGFLLKFSPSIGIGGSVFSVLKSGIQFSYTPYSGYNMLYNSLTPIGTLMSSALEIMTAKLLFFTFALYAWPYLLFGGIILRVTIFTRKIGGLLIAIAIGIVFLYPVIFSLEYITLGNSNSYNVLNPYFTPTKQSQQLSSIQPSQSQTTSLNEANVLLSNTIAATGYKLNFFILPKINKIAQKDGCWPPGGSLIAGESEQVLTSLIPLVSQINTILTLVGGSIPSVIKDTGFGTCTATGAKNLVFDLFDVYGIAGITIFWLPLLNIIIVLNGILGLSGLLGGDTALAGISKLI